MKPSVVLAAPFWAVIAIASPIGHPKHTTDGQRWTNLLAVGNGAIQEHGTAATDDEIYILGGIPANATNSHPVVPSMSTVEAYSIFANSWRSLAPLPLAMTHVNAAAVDGRIFVLGGLAGDGTDQVWRAVPDCFMYDPAEDTWTTLPPMPAEQARGASAIGVSDRTIYLAGGMQSLAYLPDGLQASVDTVTAYDVGTGQWSTLPSLPAPRDHVGGAVVGRTFFVVGGRDHGQTNWRDTNYALNLDAPSDGWASKSPMPTARGGLSIGVIGDRIITFGGEGNPAPDSNGVFNETEMYNVTADTWEKLDPMPHPRHGTIAASVGGRIWIPGGGTAQGAGPSNVFDSFELA